jgi:vacuolar-type H+-ATPase subunit D/Vma8
LPRRYGKPIKRLKALRIASILFKTSPVQKSTMDSQAITTLDWTAQGQLSPDNVAVEKVLERITKIRRDIKSLTSVEINDLVRHKSREIAQLQDWHDSGVLSTDEELKNLTDAIDEVVNEIVDLLTLVPADTNKPAVSV